MHGLAAFRPSPRHDELARLAAAHLRSDLTADDRDALQRASRRVSRSATAGSLAGLALGVWSAVRLRRIAGAAALAGRVGGMGARAERPVRVVFGDGRTEAIPDVTSSMAQLTRVGDYASYFFFGLGGLFLGGEFGFLTGTWTATQMVTLDPDRRERVENAYRNFRVDCLKKEIDRLESGHSLFL